MPRKSQETIGPNVDIPATTESETPAYKTIAKRRPALST